MHAVIKTTMKTQKMSGDSHNPQAELLAKLQKEMPEIFSEGKIDFSKFKATLGEDVVAEGERYGLSWAGKSDCFRQIQETTTNTLKPQRDESVNFDDTENLFIEGDNLQVMKVLQKSYYGKVKMIYIDPPYNTGNDFIYNDKFSQAKKEYLQEIGAIDELGNVVNAELYRQNTRDSGHFHSTWLNMMYPRLFLARNLLRQDGVIFVSIDDNEVANLRKMMDEIFGEENFVESFAWRSRLGKGSTSVETATLHEYILCYARNKNEINFSSDVRIKENEQKERLRQWGQGDKREDRPSMYFSIKSKKHGEVYPIKPDGSDGRWRASKEKIQQMIDDKLIVFEKQDDGRIEAYRIIPAGSETKTAHDSILDSSTVKTTAHGSKEMKQLFDERVFDYPKPTTLIKQLMRIVGDLEDSFVLDFFAGSGTTAHAVAQLNAEDGGSRKWICVQLPEKCDPKNEAAKAGYTTIADIGKERIRRANKKIAEKNKGKKLDLGFKVFKLKESNFKIWNTQIENVEQLEQQMLDFIDNVREEATGEDLLYELILKSGRELNVPIEEKKTDGQNYFRIGNGSLVICLADKLTKPLFEAIAKDKPEKIITLDRAFGKNDQLKTNILLQAENAGVKEFKVI